LEEKKLSEEDSNNKLENNDKSDEQQSLITNHKELEQAIENEDDDVRGDIELLKDGSEIELLKTKTSRLPVKIEDRFNQEVISIETAEPINEGSNNENDSINTNQLEECESDKKYKVRTPRKRDENKKYLELTQRSLFNKETKSGTIKRPAVSKKETQIN
jgi:hypothetical protein